jgi:hypothetical protein
MKIKSVFVSLKINKKHLSNLSPSVKGRYRGNFHSDNVRKKRERVTTLFLSVSSASRRSIEI